MTIIFLVPILNFIQDCFALFLKAGERFVVYICYSDLTISYSIVKKKTSKPLIGVALMHLVPGMIFSNKKNQQNTLKDYQASNLLIRKQLRKPISQNPSFDKINELANSQLEHLESPKSCLNSLGKAKPVTVRRLVQKKGRPTTVSHMGMSDRNFRVMSQGRWSSNTSKRTTINPNVKSRFNSYTLASMSREDVGRMLHIRESMLSANGDNKKDSYGLIQQELNNFNDISLIGGSKRVKNLKCM